MNRIFITGRLVRDPELKAISDGIEVANFSVAVDRRVGKGKEREADFFDCTAWRQTAAFVQKYFKKGDGIVIEGKMNQNRTEKDGVKRTYWTLNVDNVEFPAGGGKRNESEMTPTDEEIPF